MTAARYARPRGPGSGLGFEHQEGTVTPGHGLNSITRAKGLTSTEKLVLYVLLSHADREGLAFPGQGTIAEESGLCRGTVNRAIKGLIKRGFVDRGHKHNRESDSEPGVWELTINIDRIESARDDRPLPPSGRGGVREPPY